MSQFSVPCAVYRGGTSRGLFFHKKDLPGEWESKKRIFLAGIDSSNLSQINGLGSGTSHTSKAVIIGPPSVKGADVDFTFVQVGIGEPLADAKGTCGNLMSAVGPFAIDEGLVKVDPLANEATVYVYDTNIGKKLKLVVPVEKGKAKVSGDYPMPGVVQPGARIRVAILDPGGGKTGKTLPLGARSSIKTGSGIHEISFVDVVNPFVFIAGRDLGLSGTEPWSEIAAKVPLLDELNSIRDEAAVAAGMAGSPEEARTASPAVPKIAFVAESQDYRTTSGQVIKKEEIDILAKMLSMGRLHRTFAGSGLYSLAAAVLLPGTIPYEAASLSNDGQEGKERILRIGHPDGVAEVRVALTADGKDIAYVGMDRTARRIMKGELSIPEN